ncbi:fungal-specific transcription factor domain-containing protein [Schizophyllum commune]
MSSSEDNNSPPVKGSKKRRLPHACDNCRKRKVKCDSARMNGQCTNCISFDIPCEHTIPSRRRGAQKEYVEALESRIKQMEDMLKQAGKTFNESEGSTSSSPSSALARCSEGASSSSHASPDYVEREDEYERMQAEVVNNMKTLRITDCSSRYFGPASTFHLVSAALYVKAKSDEIQGNTVQQNMVYDQYRDNYRDHVQKLSWDIMPWEQSLVQDEDYEPLDFPEDDLLQHLIDVYFEIPNMLNPILHRPTFEKELSEGLHKTDWYFGAVVLMVCASAARYTSDRRVLLPGNDDWRSAGWKWFNQVPLIRRKSLFMLPSVHELQYYGIVLTCVFGTSAPQSAWPILGISIRYCQEMGIHRKSADPHFVHNENEHWNRAFWSLVTSDRIVSSFLGRQPCISADDIDADPPVECDDEYWDTGNPATVFKQPPRVPSKMSFFTHYVKLTDILSHAQSALYTTAKSRIRTGNIGPEWEQRIAAELDSELNQWLDNLPDHLRWDPKRENRLFFNQSSVLYATYYHVQHVIHRPFIGKTSPVTFASIAMCCNAARACSRIYAAQVDRGDPIVTSELLVTAFTSAVSCLMNIWGGRKMGMSIDQRREMEYVRHCLRYLEVAEVKWYLAGKFREQIQNLANIQEAAGTPEYSSKKRPRDESPPPEVMSSGASSSAQPTPDDGAGLENTHAGLWDSSDTTYWNVNNMLFPQTDPGAASTQQSMGHNHSFAQQRPFDPFVSLPNPQAHAGHPQHLHAPSLEGLTEADLASLPVPMDDVFDMWSQLPSSIDPRTWDSYISSLEQPKTNTHGLPEQALFLGH